VNISRRHLITTLAAFGSFPRLTAMAAPERGRVKITAIKAMQIKDIANNCLASSATARPALPDPWRAPGSKP
jgi:hypothetical protein